MSRTALVTGGTGGLGTAVTRTLLAEGWRVVVPWTREEGRDRLGAADGLELVRADLFEPADVARCVELAAGEPGAPLRAVVNLVGGFGMGPKVHEAPVEDFEWQLRLNLRPTYLVSQAAIPHLVAGGGGSVVCLSSRAAVRPFPGAAGYVTAKAAVLAFVAALDAEYRGDGIRANAVLPGVIDTPANRTAMPNADRSGWVAPEEIAKTIVFLCGDSSGVVSGAQVPVWGRG
ncbi:NAD(P)-dependent dehydrogenase, short-chain alcohol dehydrogenase family [Amycolatopsis arida]|uniref:NAD(P)-dependent dehydrogenase, short-chain alcohol dehydrogenase family n=1 Tax=Amycolatopsis arida TaxID=587909 RepID=A0A1I5LP83_9PSEU|nr:SDR family NAD(P)-dependent oxidoreductase [Amycolatopsis arida]TDX93789.1 NAD(P)-dependent dehydrogenase (short-subunit alcohol dehydrogenase family) [Amycolatopsis arida]SFO99045.1 NAD(P)-dependent dehydrogenase, short-chain alcohol dehydrogenase family [Amycolatopsis arida]